METYNVLDPETGNIYQVIELPDGTTERILIDNASSYADED